MNPTGEQLLRRVAAALTQVRDPRGGEDVVSTGRVRDLQATDDGMVHVWHFFCGLIDGADDAVGRVGEFVRKQIG